MDSNIHYGTVQKRSNSSLNREPERTVRLYGEWENGDLSLKNEFFRSSRGFTLIEVLVASVILSSVFFAILTLISNNSRQATNLEHSKTMDRLFLSSKACIEYFWYPYLASTGATQGLNFGTANLGCSTGSYLTDLSFTGISLEKRNGTETGATTFWSYFRVQDNTGTLKVYNTISDGTEKKDYDFVVGQ